MRTSMHRGHLIRACPYQARRVDGWHPVVRVFWSVSSTSVIERELEWDVALGSEADADGYGIAGARAWIDAGRTGSHWRLG